MINLFLVALASIFVYLKLEATTAVATWSWFWVLSPIIIPYVGMIVLMALISILIILLGGKPTITYKTKPTIKYGKK